MKIVNFLKPHLIFAKDSVAAFASLTTLFILSFVLFENNKKRNDFSPKFFRKGNKFLCFFVNF